MSGNRKLISAIGQLLPKSWLERKPVRRAGGDKLFSKPLNPDLPLHQQIKNQAIYSLLSTVEPHFEIIHDLLVWKFPDQSIAAFFVINVFFWFIVFLSSHLITAVAFLVFMYKVQEFWSTVIWPEIALEPPTPPNEQENWTCVDPNLLSAPEITRFVDSCLNWVKHRLIAHWHLRSNNHLAFFLINLLVFTGLGYLGTVLSGAVIIYFLLVATLLAPGINVHLLPFLKSASSSGKEAADLKKSDKHAKLLNAEEQSDQPTEATADDQPELTNELSEEPNGALNAGALSCEASHSGQTMNKGDVEQPDHLNLEKASRLFGQIFESTKCYLNQMFENEPTEEFIKQKEDQLTKAHDFLTDVVLNQDPNFKVDNNELNNSFKYLESEFKKLDQLKDSVKLSAKSSNSIESNLVPSYFENDSASSQSSDDDFEIIPSQPPYQ